ncbi:MAG: hypothetical protein JXQ83_08220, partial [Candidatus Glassbacteria bacterium]|nr:hypothetical protein [Candidatus Glassbacteria bacterium]
MQTNGPEGGYISDIAITPADPQVCFAVGPQEGVYKSTDGGESWSLIQFDNPGGHVHIIAINPQNQSEIYCAATGELQKTVDAGQSWQHILGGVESCTRYIAAMEMDPLDGNVLYICGGSHCPERAGTVYRTEDGGSTWSDLGTSLELPRKAIVETMGLAGNGKLFIGINDYEMESWRCGKVFYSDNDGQAWSEVNYGQSERRFIWSTFVNPFNRQEIWISEGPLYNDEIGQPIVYKSTDGGLNWSAVFISANFDCTQVRIIGASVDGRIYLAAGSRLLVTSDGGSTFSNIEPPLENMPSVDFRFITVHPDNPAILLLPLRTGGIARSEDGGKNWRLINKGILSTTISLLAADPVNPAVIYASSAGGNGTFRSDDYGESWTMLNPGGIVHPWADELTVDPTNPDRIWFVSDVPYIHRSDDRGNTWEVINNPYWGNNFNFCSVYACTQSSGSNIIYALNNGFGLFKRQQLEYETEWSFLRTSEIDYTYSITAHPTNPDIVFSGYSPKPFEHSAMVRRTTDGGETWNTVLEVPNSSGITSVAVDPGDPGSIYAGSIGERGEIYYSSDGGSSWTRLNEHFIMCTVWGQPQLIVDPGNPLVVYAATWLAGTWKTEDAGATWTLLEEAPLSATSLSLNPLDADQIYLSDRTAPVLWKTSDAGSSWRETADFSADRAFLLNRVLADGNNVYAATFGPGIHGGKLYKSTDSGSSWADLTGTLPRSVLDLAVNPSNRDNIFVTTHIHGAYKSTDGGANWTIMQGFPDIGAYDIEIDPVDPNILYTCGMGACTVPGWCMEPDGYTFTDPSGVYKSTDSGLTWNRILTTGNECRAIRIHPDNHEVLFAAAMDDGLQVSTDGGNSWTSCNAGLDSRILTSCAVAEDKIYVGTQGCGVYSGDINMSNWSVTWRRERSNKPVPQVYSLEIKVEPSNSFRIFVGSNPGGLYRTDDAGASFYDKNFLTPSVVVEDPLRQGYYTFAINPKDPQEVWLGTWGKGIYKSYDGMDFDVGASGSDRQMYGKYITQVAIDPDPPHTVYAATDEGVFQTNDGGNDWVEISQGLASTDVRVLYMNSSGELYAGTKGYGMYRWRGDAWEAMVGFGNWGVVWPIWDDRPMYQYTSLLIHPEDNSKIILGTFPQGIYKSLDGGASWRESNVGWTNDGVFSLICHPDNPDIVFVGTYNGVNRSLDFGDHWEMWDKGWPAEQWVFSIDFDPGNAGIMYACSKNGENEGTGREGFKGTVMKSLNGGADWFEIVNGLDLDQEFYKIIVDRFNSDRIYLAAQNDGVFVSNDGGNGWAAWNEGLTNPIPGTNGNNVTNMMAMSADHSILYFGSWGSGVFRRMITPVLPVNNLSAESRQNQVILKWRFDDLNNNFSHYNIYKSTEEFTGIDGMSPYSSINSLTTATFQDNYVEAGVKYYYAVTTNDASGYENDRVEVLGPVVLSDDEPPVGPGKNCDFSGDGTIAISDVITFLLLARDNPGDPRLDWNEDGKYTIGDAINLLLDIMHGNCP